MVLKVKNITPRCYSNSDGEAVYGEVKSQLLAGNEVSVSFEGVDTVTSSFVNSAFIELLDSLDFDKIRDLLHFTDTTPQINQMIKSRFRFEVERRQEA